MCEGLKVLYLKVPTPFRVVICLMIADWYLPGLHG